MLHLFLHAGPVQLCGPLSRFFPTVAAPGFYVGEAGNRHSGWKKTGKGPPNVTPCLCVTSGGSEAGLLVLFPTSLAFESLAKLLDLFLCDIVSSFINADNSSISLRVLGGQTPAGLPVANGMEGSSSLLPTAGLAGITSPQRKTP